MLTFDLRKHCTIATIEYSDSYEDNFELFNKGIEILKEHEEGSELDTEDREILEEIFTILELEGES